MVFMRKLIEQLKIRLASCNAAITLFIQRNPRLTVALIVVMGIFPTVVYWRSWWHSIPIISAYVGDSVLRFAQNHSRLSRILHVLLDAVPDAVPLLLAVAGLGYCMPDLTKHIEKHKPIRVGLMCLFIMFGILAIGVNAVNREGQEHDKEGQDRKMDVVNTSVGRVLDFLVSTRGTTNEAERRVQIQHTLRDEYIMSHDLVDPEILSGARMPPEDWMNARLSQIGEHWKFSPSPSVAAATPIPQIIPESKQAEIGVSFYKDDMVESPQLVSDAPSDQETFKVDVSMFATGNTPAKVVMMWFRVCDGCAWESEPSGSIALADRPSDREFSQPEMLPNVTLPKITLSIKRPIFPKFNNVEISFYSSCEACPPVDSKKPIRLLIRLVPPPKRPSHIAPYFPKPAI
jgi:hypothetical protein